jgi:hypothetical protein
VTRALALTLALAVAPATPGHGWVGTWSPGIGDPTVVGWITVVAYLWTAWRCHQVGRRLGAAKANRREIRVWSWLAVLFLALGINKQLDLQSALTEWGRMLARSGGWYAERGHVQREFIALVAAGGLVAIAVGLWVARRTSRAARLAIAGALVVVTFVVIRAASFHHVDIFIRSTVAGLKMNWILELSGILLVLLATFQANRIEVRAPRGAERRPGR